jgi:DNA-binding CsgD family transcriptional regulator/catechol 2,3-dioxygenase-like lactoylglutathione lyase family enzyme
MQRRRKGRPAYDDVLTPAEWQTLHAIQHGMSNREIAIRRRMSLDAVKYHVKNIRAKLGIESRVHLRQWFRAPAESELKRGSGAMKNSFEIVAVGQVARTVKDIEATKRFYGETLGLEHLYTFGNLTFFQCGSTRLMFTTEQGVNPHESILYLRVPDIQQAHGSLVARGVTFVGAPHMIHKHADGTEEWMGFFNDPEGRMLAIMAQAKRG